MRTASSRTDRYADHLANLATVPIVQSFLGLYLREGERERKSRREVSRLEEDGIIFEKVYINSDLVRHVLKFKLIHSRLTYFVKQQECVL